MMSIEQVLVWSAILTFVMALAGSYYRNRAWDLEGMRRAMNMLENLVVFTALAAALHFSGRDSVQAQLGANIFFWARVAYFPAYLAGLALRPHIWSLGAIGLVMMAAAALW